MNRDIDRLFCAHGKITNVITKNPNMCTLYLGKRYDDELLIRR